MRQIIFWCSCLFFIWNTINLNSVQAQTVDDLHNYYNRFADKYLIKHSENKCYYSIDGRGITTYASLSAKRGNRPECRIYWDEIEIFRNLLRHRNTEEQLKIFQRKGGRRFTKNERIQYGIHRAKLKGGQKYYGRKYKPLSGYKIALDPGHFAGDFETAKIEGKFIELAYVHKDTVRFYEANLTLTTARLLKDKLTRAGANVLITRPKAGVLVSGKTFKQWKQSDFPALFRKDIQEKRFTQVRAQKLKKFDARLHTLYLASPELALRADIINAYDPDLTIAIHYNADPDIKAIDQPSSHNYNMTFVAGAFMRHEMDEPEERLHFLRILLMQNFDKSVLASKYIIRQFEQKLKVNTIPKENHLGYLKNASIYVQHGVYARNLGLCRRLNSPLCFGETLVQNHRWESERLKVNRLDRPAKRVQEVSEAYYQGILQYFRELKRQKK